MRLIEKIKSYLAPVDNRGGWWGRILEPFAGAWQRNISWDNETVLAFHAVYACISLISADIGKLRFKEVRLDENDIWVEVKKSKYAKLLKKPNNFQNHIQFKEWWITSKLIRGNAYVLKQLNATGDVIAMYLLDPNRVQVLVASNGDIYYQLGGDNLTPEIGNGITVPASQIIHDRMNCLFHPLVGISPLYACGLAAHQGLKIQEDSSKFFANGANPSGILTAPAAITDETAKRLKEHWEDNYTGHNSGRVAVLGDGLEFQQMKMSAVDAQLIEQLNWTAKVVCSTFHVPPMMIGVGGDQQVSNVDALYQYYYSQCLQSLIESMELCLDNGLGMADGTGTELDLEGLLRMDSKAQMETLKIGVDAALVTPNEGRKTLNRPPLPGGNTVYMQQQNYSIEALAGRDSNDPFAKNSAPSSATSNESTDSEDNNVEAQKLAAYLIEKFMSAEDVEP